MTDPKPARAPFRMTPVVFHVLFSLAGEEAHAYGMMKDIASRTADRVKIGPGSLHFTLSKLSGAGMVEESEERPDPTMDDARRKYYRLTGLGREVLEAELGTLAGIVDLARDRNLVPRRGAI